MLTLLHAGGSRISLLCFFPHIVLVLSIPRALASATSSHFPPRILGRRRPLSRVDGVRLRSKNASKETVELYNMEAKVNDAAGFAPIDSGVLVSSRGKYLKESHRFIKLSVARYSRRSLSSPRELSTPFVIRCFHTLDTIISVALDTRTLCLPPADFFYSHLLSSTIDQSKSSPPPLSNIFPIFRPLRMH